MSYDRVTIIRCVPLRFLFDFFSYKELVTCTVYGQVGTARFRAPELLFRPDLIGDESEGIHEMLAFAVQRADLDIRKLLYTNIVLSGGSTLFRGSYFALTINTLLF